jgi:hypothetical protein
MENDDEREKINYGDGGRLFPLVVLLVNKLPSVGNGALE